MFNDRSNAIDIMNGRGAEDGCNAPSLDCRGYYDLAA